MTLVSWTICLTMVKWVEVDRKNESVYFKKVKKKFTFKKFESPPQCFKQHLDTFSLSTLLNMQVSSILEVWVSSFASMLVLAFMQLTIKGFKHWAKAQIPFGKRRKQMLI